ncbi:glycosyltransferase, partial [Cetobacterium sp.]|uniref:glycosyltransferase n=1 Tax=Cetobacterium sp. TaxID=2071632 RepID=UPI003EE5A29B
EYYNRAKVFILPSKWESFGIVMVEAQAFNNYILTSPTFAAKDITDNEKVGKIFKIENESELLESMQNIIEGSLDLSSKEKAIVEYKKRFKYSVLIERIKDGL